MAKRAGNINSEQKNILIEFVKKNPQINVGKFTKDFTYKDSQMLWDTISKILNSVPGGGNKTWKQWRKVWQDLKTKTKQRSVTIKKHMAQTGGGAPTNEILDENDMSVIDILTPTAIDGIEGVEETRVTLFADSTLRPIPVEVEVFVEMPETENIATLRPEPVEVEVLPEMPETENIEDLTYSDIQSTSAPEIAKISSAYPTIPPTASKLDKAGSKRPRKFEKTLSACENITKLTKAKIEIKDNYYKEKLKLYRQHIDILQTDVEIKKQIADSLLTLNELLGQNKK